MEFLTYFFLFAGTWTISVYLMRFFAWMDRPQKRKGRTA